MEQAAEDVRKKMTAGELPNGIQFSDEVASGKVTIAEMIGTDDGAKEFIEKITYDVFSGRETVPLLYKAIYSTREDRNFPKTMSFEEFGPVEVVFVEKFEGGEIKFGSMGPGTEKSISFKTWAAGIEYDEDIIEYNQTWRVSDIGAAFGESYNKLLNHLHLSPIISGTYITTGGGMAAQKAAQEDADAPVAQLIAFDTDIKTTMKTALQVLPLADTVLYNSADAIKLEEAAAGDMLSDNSAALFKRRFSQLNKIAYDGDYVKVGKKTHEYGGVPVGFCFLIVSKRNFVEYIKHDLRVDSGDGDLSRLIVTQIVGRARRAVFVVLGGRYGAIKVDIAA